MKDFYLFLDESGDFDLDLQKPYQSECLVGGLLVLKENIKQPYEIDNMMLEAWKKCFPERKNEKRAELLCQMHHATEIEYEKKAKPVFYLLNTVAQLGEFIIFENYQKSRVIDSTLTYANILAEGIIQLMIRLSLENRETPIRLNVLVGGRRDMTANEIAYIDVHVLKSRIEERIKLLEIKNQSLHEMGATYTLTIGNDKKDSYLIACDYVCHFYFKRQSEIYNTIPDGETEPIRDLILKYYDSGNVFSLKGNAEKERILQGFSEQDYGNLLYEIAVGLIEKETSKKNIIDAFLILPEKTRKIHLKILSNYFDEVIGNIRDLELGERMVSFGRELCMTMESRDKEDDRFKMDVILYELTIRNHRGNLAAMQKLFEEAKPLIGKLVRYAENIEYIFILLNRYSVFLMDCFQIEEAYELLEHLIKQFSGYELLGEELLDNPILYECAKNQIVDMSIQKGKLLGTQVQVATILFRRGMLSYDDVVAISDNAIKNFTDARDIQRQYQYRADLEGYASHLDLAYSALKRGYGVESINEIGHSNESIGFVLYHMSIFFKCFYDNPAKEVVEIRRYLKNNVEKILYSGKYPEFITIGNLAEAYSYDEKSEVSRVKKYFKAAIEYKENEPVLFIVLKWMLRCSYIEYLYRIGDKEMEGEKEEAKRICGMLKTMDIPESIKKMLLEFEGKADCADKFSYFAGMRQY